MATDINTAAVVASLAEADYVFASLAAGAGPRRVLRSALGTKAAGVLAVGTTGSDSTGTRGRLDRPFLTLAAAKTAASSGDTIIVYPGAYTVTTDVSGGGIVWLLLPGASMTASGGGVLPGYDHQVDLNQIRVGAVTAGTAPVILNVGTIVGKGGTAPSQSAGGVTPSIGDVIIAGAENGASQPGSVIITGGDADTGTGGNAYVLAGIGGTGGNTCGSVYLGSTEELGPIFIGVLPTTNPGVAGRLWRDPAAGNVVKQSQG